MSDTTISRTAPCYYLDPATGKTRLGTYDFSRLLELQAKAAAEARASIGDVGTATLTEDEIGELAGRYDPTRMTNAQYNDLIDYLVDRGVLSKNETYGVYSDRVILRPGCYLEGCFAPDLPPADLSVRTLADAGGDALRWTGIMARWDNSGSVDVQIRANAFRKIAGVLGEMDAYRQDQEKLAEAAANADELMPAMDRVVYEQKGDVDTQSIHTHVNGEHLLGLYRSFLEEHQRAEEEEAEFNALMDAADGAAAGEPAMDPKELLERLPGPARDTLEKVKSGRSITYQEWDELCGSLWVSGAISRAEYDIAMGRLIPVGYTDENGERVHYEGVAERFGLVDLLRRLSGREAAGESPLAWSGDPLAFLDSWIAEFTDWREELSRQRRPDGTAKYDDFSPIDSQVDACSKVSGLVRGLLGQLGADVLSQIG